MKELHTTTCQMSTACKGEEGDRGGLQEPPFCLILWSSQVGEGCLQGGPVNLGRLQGGGLAHRRSRIQTGPDDILMVGCVKPVT